RRGTHVVLLRLLWLLGVDNRHGGRLHLLDDAAERVVDPLQGAGLVVDAGEAANAHVAGEDRIPGVGDALGRSGRIILRGEPAGIVVAEVGDDAAAVGDLRWLAERVHLVDGGAAVGTAALDHVAEAVAHVGGDERARVRVGGDLVLAVA